MYKIQKQIKFLFKSIIKIYKIRVCVDQLSHLF